MKHDFEPPQIDYSRELYFLFRRVSIFFVIWLLLASLYAIWLSLPLAGFNLYWASDEGQATVKALERIKNDFDSVTKK